MVIAMIIITDVSPHSPDKMIERVEMFLRNFTANGSAREVEIEFVAEGGTLPAGSERICWQDRPFT